MSYIENKNAGAFRKITNIFSVSPKGSMVAGIPNGSSGKVYLYLAGDWNASTEIPLDGSLSERAGIVRSLAFSFNEERLAVGRSGGRLDVYDRISKSYVFRKQMFRINFSPNALAFDAESKFLAAGARQDYGLTDHSSKLFILQVKDWLPIQLHGEIGANIYSMSWNDSGVLAVGSAGGLTIIQSQTGDVKELIQRSEQDAFYSVKFSPNNRLAASVGSDVYIFTAGSHI